MAAKEFLAKNNIYLDEDGNINFDKKTIENAIKRLTSIDYTVYSKIQAASSAILNVKPPFTDKKNKMKPFDEKAFVIADRANKDYFSLIKYVHKPEFDKQIEDYLSPFHLLKPCFDIIHLIPYSFFLQFKFTLAKPFISRDDEVFYIIENPVKKDKVFKVPMISPSGWKGNLRWTAGRNFIDTLTSREDEIFTNRLQLIRLFGNETETINHYYNKCIRQRLNNKIKTEKEKEEIEQRIGKQFKQYLEKAIPAIKDSTGLQGRLHFYPTFFDKIDLEVINPHDRKTRAGKNPIYFEVVPAATTGVFSLVWFLFDLAENKSCCKQALKEDWDILKAALKNMFFLYGFSAKKTSGFGVIENSIRDTQFTIAGTKVDLQDNKEKFFNDFLNQIDKAVTEVVNE